MHTKHTYKFYSNIKLKWHKGTALIALILENNDYLTDKILMAVPWGLTVLSQEKLVQISGQLSAVPHQRIL